MTRAYNELYLGKDQVAMGDMLPSGCYDKSPEYFAGWSLAYYSWYRNMSYDDIQKIIPINEVVEMYEPFHEMDVRQFVDALDKRGT